MNTDGSHVIVDAEMPPPNGEETVDQARLIEAAPDDPFPIPTVGEPFVRAPDLQALADDLLKRDAQEIADLNWTLKGATVRFLWKQHGGTSRAAPVLARCVKMGGLTKHYGRAEFTIWCAADHLADMEPTFEQMRALIFHELSHIEKVVTEDGEISYRVRAHDAEIFVAEVALFGAWRADLEAAQEAFEQLGLVVD